MARLFMGLALAVLASGSPVAAARSEQEIIGYVYACAAKVAMPLPFSDLEGELVLNEDGTRDSFFAKVYGMKSEADPVGWASAENLRRLGKGSIVRWSMSWREQGGELPSFGGGLIELDVSTPRKLQLENILLLDRSEGGSEPLEMGSRRWPGRKNGAGFLFEFSKLLAFAGDSDTLGYRLYSGSVPRDWKPSPRRLRAAGRFDIAAPRSLAGPFAALLAELRVKAGDWKACEKRPVYDNPAGEI